MDKEVIERCKSGDIHAFGTLFEEFGEKLFGLCLRMSGDRNDAEDIIQEIFVILIKKIRAFRGDAKFSTWLYRVAINTCISFLRKKKSITVSLEDVLASRSELAVKPQPVIQRELLKKAITLLPDGYRTTIVLHDIQGYNHREIAEIMGTSIGASKSQLFKARKKLKDLITAADSTSVVTGGVNYQVMK